MVRLEPACEVEQETAGRGHVDTPIRALQDRLHPGPLALRQMIEDVAQLVHLAALDKGDRSLRPLGHVTRDRSRS